MMTRRLSRISTALTVSFIVGLLAVTPASAADLDSTLTHIAREKGREIVFSSDLVRGLQSGVISAPDATAEELLTQALAGTGLHWRAIESGTIVIEADNPTVQQEIMVTAQRRDERAQDVPVSVSAFGASAIDAHRLERLRDVSRLTPGLLVSSFSQSSPTIAIRGASNTFTQIGVNKPVAVVVDDVFVPRNSAADFELFGLDSIQVLRGPQGTLFGRNVTGGAILLSTGRPRFDQTAGRLKLTAGDFSAQAADGLVDWSPSSRLAFRIAGSIHQHDGYGRDRLTGLEEDDEDSRAVRAQVRTLLTPELELLAGVDYGDDENGGRTLSSISAGDDGDRRTSELGVPQHFRRTQKGGSVRLFWDAGAGTMTSISALRKSQANDLFANVGANFVFLTGTQSQLVSDDADDVRAFSQEVRYASPLWDRGHFIAGAYFLDENSRRLLQTTALAARTGALVTRQAADQAVDSRSIAGFLDGTLNLPARLAITIGARYTTDRKEASLTRADFIAPRNNFTASDLGKSWSEVTPRAIVSWTPLADLHTYLSYSRGYTAGGFNTEAAVLTALKRPFDPETVDNIEAGIKTDWLRDRLRLNLAAFRMTYDNKQELFFDNITRILTITNAADAQAKGIELEARATLTRWLTLGGSYGFLDTRYDNFLIPGGAVYTGNPLSSSPRHKYSVNADLHVPLGNWGSLLGAAMYSKTGEYFTGASADAGLRVPAYDLVNLSLGVTSMSEQWSITAFVRNLTDTEYLLTPSTQTVRAEYLGEPRTAGVSFNWRF